MFDKNHVKVKNRMFVSNNQSNQSPPISSNFEVSFDFVLRCEKEERIKEQREPASLKLTIVHFTVECLVTWPLSGSEVGVDLVLTQTLLLFICKYKLVSMRST